MDDRHWWTLLNEITRYARSRTRKNPIEQGSAHGQDFSRNTWMTDIDKWKKKYTRIRTQTNLIKETSVQQYIEKTWVEIPGWETSMNGIQEPKHERNLSNKKVHPENTSIQGWQTLIKREIGTLESGQERIWSKREVQIEKKRVAQVSGSSRTT